MAYINIHEIPSLCSAIFGELHAIVVRIFNTCGMGMHDAQIKQSTHISDTIVTDILTDLCEAGIILFDDWFWVVNKKILLSECCPPAMLKVLHVRVVKALRINRVGVHNSITQLRKHLKRRHGRGRTPFKKRKQ